MPDIEVHIDLNGRQKRVGTLHRQARRGGEAVAFQYHADWLADPDRFSLEPALTLGQGAFSPAAGLSMFGSIGDSAPDTWGRRLMQRAERRQADRAGRPVRTLAEADYLLGVAELFDLSAAESHQIIKEVAAATRTWRDVAAAAGARPAEIRRMESAFEHDDLQKALAL